MGDITITEWKKEYDDESLMFSVWSRVVKYSDGYYSVEYLMTRNGYDPNNNKPITKWDNIL
jgi:hypothetical protein